MTLSAATTDAKSAYNPNIPYKKLMAASIKFLKTDKIFLYRAFFK